MPVEFLTDEEAARYGRYGERLSRLVLAKLFFLDDDKVLIGRHRGPHMMLGFALQLVTVRRADAHRPRRLTNLGAHVREGPGDPDLGPGFGPAACGK